VLPAVPFGSKSVSVNIAMGQAAPGESERPLLITTTAAETDVRDPCDVCCLIDISWSMSMEATVQGADGTKAESNGLSMLDVAKHAVRTIMRSLNEHDRLSIVQFSRTARTVLPLTFMSPQGQAEADLVLDDMGFGQGTAVWKGLECAITEFQGAIRPDERFAHVMLLTDGETEDKTTIMQSLQEVKRDNNGRLPCTISCFGFGYETDSQLLVDLASTCNGTYAFIPDAGFVGTVFVNCVSNLLVTAATDAVLNIKATDPASVATPVGYSAETMPDGSLRVTLGSLAAGQPRGVVMMLQGNGGIQVELLYETASGRQTVAGRQLRDRNLSHTVEKQLCRCLFVQALEKAAYLAQTGTSDDVQKALEVINKVGERVASSSQVADEQVAALLEDIVGQSSVALSRTDYWNRWGKHYLPSVMLAHKLQQCNNFKDPGVQFYGGSLFETLRDQADNAFDRLNAPKITPARYRYLGNGKVVLNQLSEQVVDTPAKAPVSMAAFNDRYGGCIDGSSEALLASGERRRVCDLRKGDLVSAGGGVVAEVLCVVRSGCPNGLRALVELAGGARLTPFHPVCLEGLWCFPMELAELLELPCEAVYSFVLRGAPSLLVGDVRCIALGHGLQEGAAKHPYFGSNQVLEDLALWPGYEEGLVVLPFGCEQRDPETGLVCGLPAAAQLEV